MQKDATTAVSKKQPSRRQQVRRVFPDRRTEQRADPERRQRAGRRKSDKA